MRRTTKIIFNCGRKNNTLAIYDLYDRFMKRNKNKIQSYNNITKELLLSGKIRMWQTFYSRFFFYLSHQYRRIAITQFIIPTIDSYVITIQTILYYTNVPKQ